jgi:hypothetical protein
MSRQEELFSGPGQSPDAASQGQALGRQEQSHDTAFQGQAGAPQGKQPNDPDARQPVRMSPGPITRPAEGAVLAPVPADLPEPEEYPTLRSLVEASDDDRDHPDLSPAEKEWHIKSLFPSPFPGYPRPSPRGQSVVGRPWATEFHRPYFLSAHSTRANARR